MFFFNLKDKCSRFTLIELLVIIGIIAVLATILVPVVHSVREKSRVPVCLSNLRQIAMMHIAYADANDDVFCPAYDDSYRQWDSDGNYKEGGILSDCLEVADASSDEIFACPDSSSLDASDGYFPKYAGYGYNYLLSFNEKNRRRTVRQGNIKMPAQIVIMADAACTYSGKITPTSFLYPPSSGTGGYADFRHGGKAGVSYVDCHADVAKRKYPAPGLSGEIGERLGYLYKDNTPYDPCPRKERD